MLYQLDSLIIAARIGMSRYFQRLKDNELGGGDLIATIVIVAVILVLALAFRKNLTELVSNLWNQLVKDQKTENPTVPEWKN